MTTESMPPDPFVYEETLSLTVRVGGYDNRDKVQDILYSAAQGIRAVLGDEHAMISVVFVGGSEEF